MEAEWRTRVLLDRTGKGGLGVACGNALRSHTGDNV